MRLPKLLCDQKILAFVQGESALAVETLLRLGEDIELILRQLLLGSVRRSLRAQIAKEMESYGYLRRHEWEILERISLLEVFSFFLLPLLIVNFFFFMTHFTNTLHFKFIVLK